LLGRPLKLAVGMQGSRDMTRSLLARFIPLALAILAGACSGTNDSSTGPSPVTPVASPGMSGVPSPSGSSCTLSITGLPTLVPGQGGSYTFGIAVASGCPWTAQTDVTWADVSPSSGQGNAAPRLNVGENMRVDGRSLSVTVGGQSFRMTQVSGCSYSLDPTSLNESGEAGSARISVTTTLPQCSWTATSSESWIRVLTPSGTGSGAITLDLDSNPSDVRHAFLTIAGKRVDVTQRRR